MSYADRIRAGRQALGLTEEAFGKLVGVSRGAVQQWEKGDTAPKRARQVAVANALGISVAQLMADGDTVKDGPKIYGKVPLLSDVQAGDFHEFVDNFHPGDGGQELIATSVPIRQHTFALRVKGDSMEPEFHEGMILIVEPEMDAQPGDFVVARNGNGETTFKQLVKDGGEYFLRPLNTRYPIRPVGDTRIIGVVRAVERRFR